MQTNQLSNRLYPVFYPSASAAGQNSSEQNAGGNNNQFSQRLAAIKSPSSPPSRITAEALAESFTKALPKAKPATPQLEPLENTYLGWGWHEDAIFSTADEGALVAA